MNKKAVVIVALWMLLPLSLMAEANVTRATLKNGLRVVIIRNPLAPVVSIYQNYMVGGDETPPGISWHGTCAGAYGLSWLLWYHG